MSDHHREQNEPLLSGRETRRSSTVVTDATTTVGRDSTDHGASFEPGAMIVSELDVERAETSNIRSIERKQQAPLFSNLVHRTAESWFRIYPRSSSPVSASTTAAHASSSPVIQPDQRRRGTGGLGDAPAQMSSSKAGKAVLPGRSSSLPRRPAAVGRAASEASAASAATGAHRDRLLGYLNASMKQMGTGDRDGRKPPSLRAVARQIQIANAWSRDHVSASPPPTAPRSVPQDGRTAALPTKRHHRRGHSAAEILQAIQQASDGPNAEAEALADDLQEAYDGTDESVDLPSTGTVFDDDDDGDGSFKDFSSDLLRSPFQHQNDYGSLDARNDDETSSSSAHERDHGIDDKRSQRFSLSRRLRPTTLPRLSRRFRLCCRPVFLSQQLVAAFLQSTIMWVALPLFLAGIFLYYPLGNPRFDFLPGEATLSWWCDFLGRQTLTMELARLTSWIVMELVVATRCGAKLLGSHLTFFCLQGTGWPSVIAYWGIWDLLLLHGDNRFQTHWLYWTGWRIYSVANSGRYILKSPLYLRILVGMIFLGTATAVKRTVLSIRFGNRQLAEFKPRLEKIMQDAIIVSEVAGLAQEAAMLVIEDASCQEALDVLKKASMPEEGPTSPSKVLPRIRFGSVTFENRHAESDDESTSSSDAGDRSSLEGAADPPSQSLRASGMTSDSRATDFAPSRATESDLPGRADRTPLDRRRRPPALSRTESGNLRIKDTLERWEEPEAKSEKLSTAIRDILKFQRVLQSIDATYPFGEDFGPCKSRDDCIASAHSVYWKLMALSPDSSALPFETIALGAIDADGLVDEAKYNAYHRVFRPDARDQLSLSFFIQSIDTVFKHLLFFRASVRNNSVIDNVLESTINGIYYFVMSLLLLSFMEINPWPLLVSLTSLLVSVSFALGSSVSKYVEPVPLTYERSSLKGLLLITVRRPFDLGDRIIILPPEAADNPGPTVSWFVEDINLFSTTLRFARTNEVATVSNSSISASRIVNCNRSPKAIVFFDFVTKISILDGDKFQTFTAELTTFARERPRTWESLLFVRKTEVDSDCELVRFNLGFRHRNSWQDAARILLNKGDLIAHVYRVARELGVAYDSPPNRRVLYSAGALVSGQVSDYKSNLFSPSNILSQVQEDVPTVGATDVDRFLPPSSASCRLEGLVDSPMQG